MSLVVEAGLELKARILRGLGEIRSIWSEWRHFFHSCNATAFQGPDWLLPWMEAFSPEELMLVEVRRGSRLMGLAPFLVYSRDGEHVLAFMGGGVSDYLDVLIATEFEEEALAEIFRAVLETHEDWTVLELTDIPSHSPLLRSRLFKDSGREHDWCSVLHLPATKDELLHRFSNRQRANLRNARSRLRRSGNAFIEIATNENISGFLQDLFALHTTRWSDRGESGVLAGEQVRKFHLACAPALARNGHLHLSRLRLENRTLAVIYSLFSDQTAFCYLQGFDPEFASLSPGTYLMYWVICDALERGMREFDFLRGQESYKQHWRAERMASYRIHLTRRELAALIKRKSPRAA